MSYLDEKNRDFFHGLDAYTSGLLENNFSDEKPGLISNLWSSVSSKLSSVASYVPSYDKITNVTLRVGEYGWKVIKVLPHVLPSLAVNITDDVDLNRSQDQEQLKKMDPCFSELVNIMGSKIARACSIPIKEDAQEKLSDVGTLTLLESLGMGLIRKFAEMSGGFDENVIEEVVKTNFTRIALNLLKASTDEQNMNQKPIVRITALLTGLMNHHFTRVKQIQEGNGADKEAKFNVVYNELTQDLLAITLPKEGREILLPLNWPGKQVEGLIKTAAYRFLEMEMPGVLMKLYKELSAPVPEREPQWDEKFNQFVGISGADKVVDLPSHYLKAWMHDEQNVSGLNKTLERLLRTELADKYEGNELACKSMLLAGELTTTFQNLLETNDASITRAGSFVQRYFMERLVWNLYKSQQNPDGKKLIQSLADKVGRCYNELTEQQKCTEIATMILGFFGLDKKETLPLPDTLKTDAVSNLVVSSSTQFLAQQLEPLVHTPQPRQHLDELSGSTFLTTYVSTMVESVPNWILPKVKEMILSLEGLSKPQKLQLFEQVAAAIRQEPFLKEYLKAFIFKVADHVGTQHQQAQQNGDQTSLIPWTAKQVVNACNPLDIDQMTPDEKNLLLRKIELLNAKDQNTPEFQALLAEVQPLLNQMIKPKFFLLIQNLLNIGGISQNPLPTQPVTPPQSDLPVPKKLQSILWEEIESKLPGFLLDQTIHLLMPLLQMEQHKGQLQAKLPANVASLLIRGSESLAQDLREQMPFWIRDYTDTARIINTHLLQSQLTPDQEKIFGEKIAELVERNQLKADSLLNLIESLLPHPLTPERKAELRTPLEDYRREIEGIVLVPEVFAKAKTLVYSEDGSSREGDLIPREWQSSLVKELNAFLQTDRSTDHHATPPSEYGPIWTAFKLYLNGFFLKLSVQASQIDQETYDKIYTLISVTKGRLVGKNIEESKPIISEFGNEFLKLVGVESPDQLYGVPPPMRSFVFELIKQTLVSKLSDAHWVYTRFKGVQMPSDLHRFRDEIDVDKIPQATLKTMEFVTDFGLHKLEEEAKNGIAQDVNLQIGKLLEQPGDVTTVGILKEFVETGALTPVIDTFIKETLLNEDSEVMVAMRSFLKELNPILMDKFLKLIETPLRRERENGPAFNQTLLKKILPPLVEHLTKLNQVKAQQNGLPNIPINDEMFKKISTDLMYLIFPDGENDIVTLLPEDLRVHAAILKRPIWNELTRLLPSTVLPKVVPVLMDRDLLVPVLSKIFEELANELPKDRDPDFAPPTEESLQIDRWVGQVFIESARLLDLPVDNIESLPVSLRRFFGVEALKETTFEAIGRSLRLRFGGQFVKKLVDDILDTLNKLHYEKLTDEQKKAKASQTEETLKRAEEKLVIALMEAGFKSIGERIMEYLEVDPSKESLKNMIDTLKNICLFFITKVYLPIFKFIRLQSFVVRKGTEYLGRMTERGITVLQTPHLHDKFFFDEINKLKPVLT